MDLFNRLKHGAPYEYWGTTSVTDATNDALPFYLKLRYVLLFLGVDSVGAVISFVTEYHYLGILLVAVLATVACVGFTLRYAIKREFGLFWSLHGICENIRSEATKLLSPSFNDAGAMSAYTLNYVAFTQLVVDDIANFFRKLANDPSVCCAIRLAHPSEYQDDKLAFKTIARSSGLSRDRETDTREVDPDEGIALTLRTKDKSGVYVIRDFDKADADHIWKKAPNDKRSDVRIVLVAPINQCEGAGKRMLGMLYVTTAEGDFHKRHADPLKAFADLLGLVYPLVTHRVWFAAPLEGAVANAGVPSALPSTIQTGESHV